MGSIANFRKLNPASRKQKESHDESQIRDQEKLRLFRAYEGPFHPDLPIGLFGLQEANHYIPEHRTLTSNNDYPAHEIPKDEEYFEWMDILESIVDADDTFQFVEVGAGYGRWAARAFRAANLFGIREEKIYLCTIEADPLHQKWLKDHLSLNLIPTENLLALECAVSDFTGKQHFYTQRPDGISDEIEAKNWYGQALKHSGWQGAKSIQVDVQQLSKILDTLPEKTIDLIDFDIQGEEPRVISEIENQLHRVKRIHIGTNSRRDEKFFRDFFRDLNWIKIRDYEGEGIRKTYIGDISFVDGVQTYLNPKLKLQRSSSRKAKVTSSIHADDSVKQKRSDRWTQWRLKNTK